MSRPPAVTHPIEWVQEPVASAVELAGRLGGAVWVPGWWPSGVSGPELVVMRFPGNDRNRDGYHLRGRDEVGRLLVVAGYRRIPGAHLESGLRPVPGERFEILARPEGEAPHVVVRSATFDVHISGDALNPEAALDLGRSLVEEQALP